MTGKRLMLVTLAAFVGIAFGQAVERPATGIVRPAKKVVAFASPKAGAIQVSAEQSTVAKPKDDKTATAPKAVKKDDEAKPKQDKAESGWWTQKRSEPVRRDVVRAEPNPPQKKPMKEPMPPVIRDPEPRSGRQSGSGGEIDHGRGGRGGERGRGHGGWYQGRHRDFDYWRYGGRHNHHHGFWGWHWWFGPVIYIAPDYPPSVIRIPHSRAGVYVRTTGDDVIGTRFAYELRDQLREQGLRVVYDESDAALELYLVSMDLDPDETGYGSAISVSYIWVPGQRFITAQMLDVGADQLVDLAEDVAGYADDLIDEYR